MKIRALTVFVSLVFSGALFGQISGVVIDKFSENPIADVHIKKEGQLIAVTNGDGSFTISKPSGVVIFRHVGYEMKSVDLGQMTSPVEIKMTPIIKQLNETRITAHAAQKDISLIPQILAPDSLTSVSMTANPVAALNSLPAVFFNRGTRNTQKITIRGLGARSQYSTTKIKAFVNGFPVSSTSGEVFLNDMSWTTIDRLEVVPGPVSNAYGSSFGGFLFLEMALPDKGISEVKTGLTVGDYGYMHQYNSFQFGNSKVKGRINYQSMNDNGFRQNDAFDGNDLNALVEVRLSETVTLQSFTQRNTFKAFIPSSLSESDFSENPEKAAESWRDSKGFEEDAEWMQGFSIDKKYTESLSQSVMVFGRQYEGTERRPFNTLKDKNQSFGARTDFNFRNPLPVGVLTFKTGLNFRHDNYRWKTFETLDNNQSGEKLSENLQRKNSGNFYLFSQYQHEAFSLKAGINAGLSRYAIRDKMSGEKTGSFDMGVFLSPYLRARIELSPELSLGALLSRGASTPSFEEAIDSDGGISDLILPENGWQREAGLTYQSENQRLAFSSSVFYNSVNNQIITKRITEDQFIKINAGESNYRGLEARLNYLVVNRNQLRTNFEASYAYSDFEFARFRDEGVILDGKTIPGIPKHKTSLMLSGNAFEKLSFRAVYLITGKMPMNDRNTLFYDGYEVLNVFMSYNQNISNKFKLKLYALAENVLNQSYASMILVNAPSFGGSDPRYYYPGAPRSFRLGFELNYNLNIL